MYRIMVCAMVFTGCLTPVLTTTANGSEALPQDDPVMIQRGETQFARTCAVCHGHAGSGGRGKPLAERNLDAARILNTINNGLRRGASFMPAFKDTLSPVQRRELVAYLLSLGEN